MQRTFLDAWRNADRYDPGRRFTAWLFTIAHRRAVDALRRRRHLVDLESLWELSGEDGRREAVNRLVAAADVRAAVAQLPEHERVVVQMAYFADLTQWEIAERLDVPHGTEKARTFRGVRRLGQILQAAEAAAPRCRDRLTGVRLGTGRPTFGPAPRCGWERTMAGTESVRSEGNDADA